MSRWRTIMNLTQKAQTQPYDLKILLYSSLLPRIRHQKTPISRFRSWPSNSRFHLIIHLNPFEHNFELQSTQKSPYLHKSTNKTKPQTDFPSSHEPRFIHKQFYLHKSKRQKNLYTALIFDKPKPKIFQPCRNLLLKNKTKNLKT